MPKQVIQTNKAPQPLGPYSQAIRVGDSIYTAGQIGLDPSSMQMVGGVDAQTCRVFDNLIAVAEAAGVRLQDAVKLNVFLTDLANFSQVNGIMESYFSAPYPARAVIGVASLPRNALVEIDAVLVA